MLRKQMLALAILMVATFGFVLPAFATPISTIVRNYGDTAEKVYPGGNDELRGDHVKISDKSSKRFWDVFNFSELEFDTITSFDLTLDFSDTGATSFFGRLTEDWFVRPAESTSSATNTLFGLTISQARVEQTITFDTDNLNIFENIVDNKSFYLWFAEETWFNDSFKLYSAKLDIYGTQIDNSTTATPEPATMMLLGFGLLGIAGVSRKKA